MIKLSNKWKINERTDFFAGGEAMFEEDSNNDEKRNVEFDALDPARLVRVHVHSPLVKLHFLRLDVQYTTFVTNNNTRWSQVRAHGRSGGQSHVRYPKTPPKFSEKWPNLLGRTKASTLKAKAMATAQYYTGSLFTWS